MVEFIFKKTYYEIIQKYSQKGKNDENLFRVTVKPNMIIADDLQADSKKIFIFSLDEEPKLIEYSFTKDDFKSLTVTQTILYPSVDGDFVVRNGSLLTSKESESCANKVIFFAEDLVSDNFKDAIEKIISFDKFTTQNSHASMSFIYDYADILLELEKQNNFVVSALKGGKSNAKIKRRK